MPQIPEDPDDSQRETARSIADRIITAGSRPQQTVKSPEPIALRSSMQRLFRGASLEAHPVGGVSGLVPAPVQQQHQHQHLAAAAVGPPGSVPGWAAEVSGWGPAPTRNTGPSPSVREAQALAINALLPPSRTRTPTPSSSQQHYGNYFPWAPKMSEIGLEGGEYWHSRAKLKGEDREGLLVDIGARDNLTGDAWVHRVEAILRKHGQQVENAPMDQPLTVEGVGAGSQECREQARVPMILETGDSGTFVAPVIPDSDVPALLGMVTLENRRALVDVAGRKLHFLGPGEYTLPPGTTTLNLEKTESGHLMLPITEFTAISKTTVGQQGGSQTS